VRTAGERQVETLTSSAEEGFREFQAARRTIQGYEAVRWVAGDDLLRQIQFIDRLFALAN
jgi:hypothetical protein